MRVGLDNTGQHVGGSREFFAGRSQHPALLTELVSK
jgi:hypothetical protein